MNFGRCVFKARVDENKNKWTAETEGHKQTKQQLTQLESQRDKLQQEVRYKSN